MGTTNFFDGKRLIQFISSGNIASDFTSNTIEVLHLDRIGLDFDWTTSDVNGTLYIQCSIQGTNFSDLPDSNTIISVAITGTSGYQAFDIDVKAFSKIRAFFDRTSGSTGTINGYYISKGTY